MITSLRSISTHPWRNQHRFPEFKRTVEPKQPNKATSSAQSKQPSDSPGSQREVRSLVPHHVKHAKYGSTQHANENDLHCVKLRFVASCKKFCCRVHDGSTCLRKKDQDKAKIPVIEGMQFLPHGALVVCACRVIFLQPFLLFLRNRFRWNFLQRVVLYRWCWWRREGSPVGHDVSGH